MDQITRTHRDNLRSQDGNVRYTVVINNETLESPCIIRATLEDAFRITLPETPDLDPTLQRLVEQSEHA